MNYRQLLFCCFVFFLSLFVFSRKTYAVSVAITSYPSSITSDLFTITASISGAATGTNYLRVDVYKDGTTNYFGETFNGSDWYSGSDGKQYFPISVTSNVSWSGNVQARVGNPSSTYYDGTGTYKMRLRRYTSSGGQGSEDANLSAVVINLSLPTPTPTPTSAPTAASSTTSSTSTTPTATIKVSATPLITAVFPTTQTSSLAALPTDILGDSTESATATPSPEISPSTVEVLGTSENPIPKVFIAIGAACLIGCGILLLYPRIRGKFRSE
ncbi:MAG TPA: hypothetical protein VLF68_05105 [Candidatus Saccharimonadales bacterium]|nr:hypothetical protein [Candidatus Saccharimonadales bacterium]